MIDKVDDKDSKPPILGTWKRLYVFVMVQLIVLIMLFYWFTEYFS